MNENNIKIFIALHKPFWINKSEIFTPIQLGKNISNIDLGILSDDTGDNISDKNLHYNELTAMYWVWKNHTPLDYVGFYHYRRYLYLDEQTPQNGEELIKAVCDDSKVIEAVNKYDILLPHKVNLGRYNISEHYRMFHISEDWKIMINIILEKYPDYREDIINVFQKNNLAYLYSMYIMRYDLFKEYMEWLFNILFEAEKQVLISPYPYQKRVFAFMAERLFNLFIHRRLKDLKVGEYSIAMLHGNTNLEKIELVHCDAFF